MKKLIKGSEYIQAMAIINPNACNNSSIQVEVEQRDEGLHPYLHVYLDHTGNPANCAYIRLDRAAYSEHHSQNSRKRTKYLTKKQKAEFIDIMTGPWKRRSIQSYITDETKTATGYEAAVDIWIDTFGGEHYFTFDEDGFPVMPDYEQL